MTDASSDLVAHLRQLSAAWRPKSQDEIVREQMTYFLRRLVSIARDDGRYEAALHLSFSSSDYFEGLEVILENMLCEKQLDIVKTEKKTLYIEWTVSWKQ